MFYFVTVLFSDFLSNITDIFCFKKKNEFTLHSWDSNSHEHWELYSEYEEVDNCYRNSRYHQMAKGNLFDNNSNTEFDIEDLNDEIFCEFLLHDKISELEKTYFGNFFQHLRGRLFIMSTIF